MALIRTYARVYVKNFYKSIDFLLFLLYNQVEVKEVIR